MPPADAVPITDVCIIADLKRLPAGFEVLMHSIDCNDDCDLWKDGIFSKVPRYLCVSRRYPSHGSQLSHVLADVAIIDEKSPISAEYRVIDKTQDTGEKATKRKCIAVKYVLRQAASNAICELAFLSGKIKKCPVGYTIVGQVNNLTLCYKLGPVPTDTDAAPVFPAVTNNSPVPMNFTPGSQPVLPPPRVPPRPLSSVVDAVTQKMSGVIVQPTVASVSMSAKNVAHVHKNAMDGVPFKIHPQLVQLRDSRTIQLVDISYRSLIDIENEFNYSFTNDYSISLR